MPRKKVNSAVAKKIRRRNTFLGFFILVFIVVAALFTPVFNITDITVKGNKVLTPREIITVSGIKRGANLFRINTDKAEKNIASLGYVDSVEVKRKFFARVEIDIVESVEVAYVTFSGNYVGLGADGKVIGITKSSDIKPKKAIISGYGVKSVKKGSIIEGKSRRKTEIIRSLLTALKDNSLVSSVKKIDISDTDSIFVVMTSDTKINLGDSYQLDYKLKCVCAVLDELGEVRGGKIDVSDPSNVIYEGGN